MKFDIITQKIAATPSGAGFAQIHDFVPEEEDLLEARGRLMVCFAVAPSGQGFPEAEKKDPVFLTNEVIARLHEAYYKNTTATVFNALKTAVDEVSEEFSRSNEFEIGAVAIVEDLVYSAVSGGVGAMLLREQSLVKIIEGKGKKTVAASGHPKKGDHFLLGTKAFFGKLTQQEIKGALLSGFSNQAVFSDKIDSGPVSAIVASFDEKKEGVFPAIEKRVEDKKPKIGKESVKPRKKIISLIDRAIAVLPERKLKIGKDTKSLEDEKKKRTAVSAGIILLVLLAVSIGFGLWQRTVKIEKKKYQAVIDQANHELTEAKDLASLNPGRARELIVNAKESLEKIKEEGVKDEKLEELLTSLNQSMGEIAGIYEGAPIMFMDLSLVSSNFIGSGLALSEDTMSVLDVDSQKLVEIEVDTKKTNVVAGSDILSGAKRVAAYSGRSFVTNDNGILETGGDAELVVKEEWPGDSLIYAYAGNLYVMDKAENQIYRYSAIPSGFTEKQEWFGSGVETDLTSIVDWTVDGMIYALHQNGNILLFSLGSPKNFSISGVDKSLEGVVSVYTNENNEYLYMLDPTNKRVIVITKEGEYKAQYIGDEIGSATKVVASETDNKIILLTSDKLWEVEIKHL